MSQITDLRLLSEMNEIKDSRFYEYLQGQLATLTTNGRYAQTDRDATIAIGGQRILEEIIKEIDSSLDSFQALRTKEANKVDMNKTF